jgi:Tol biopolymer transport system component
MTHRRDFIKKSALGTAGLSLGAMAMSAKSYASIKGANDRFRIAVCGVNGRGKSHISGFNKLENVEIAYLVDPDSAVLEERVSQLGAREEVSAINTDELTEVPYRFAGAGMPQYSHDGSLLAVSDASAVFITDGIPDMVLVDLSDFSTMRIENAGGYVFSPVLAELYFLRYNNDLTNDIVARSLDGSGESVLLTGGYHAITSVSSDGQSIIYSHRPGAANSDVYRFGRYSGEIVQLSSSGRDNGGGQIQPLPR